MSAGPRLVPIPPRDTYRAGHGPSAARAGMIQNRDLIMESLGRFFSDPKHIGPVIDVVKGESSVSLRLIDWFVTNYSKTHDIVQRRNTEDNAYVNIYLSYRAQLKTYSKQNFDPFRRNERITFYYGEGDDDCIETTTAQLCFFRWSIENGVLDYIAAHRQEIEARMLSRGRGSPRAPAATMMMFPCKTLISFE